jgi:amino acid adenylation domain-containing protein
LSGTLIRAFIETGDNSSFSLYATMMAALKVCLHKYTGSNTLVVGSPARPTKGEVPLPAYMLPIITEVSGRETFGQFLQNVQEALSGAYDNQSYPLHEIASVSRGGDGSNECPLFDVSLIQEGVNAPLPETRNDIAVYFAARQGEIFGRVEYNVELFSRKRIEVFVEHLRNVLRRAPQHADGPIRDLDILTERERQQLLVEWKSAESEYPDDRCIHELFEAQAARTPENTAVIFGEQRLSYRELNARADVLARYLREQGVGPEAPVAICLHRSVALLVSILGVLKAGGVYVPLDPQSPRERLALIMGEVRPAALIVEPELAAEFDAPGVVVVRSDRMHAGQDCADKMPAVGVGAQNLAYVIYTSGSTGRPKGVTVSHRNLVHSTAARLSYYQDQVKAYLLLSPFFFDSSVAGIFWTLVQGGSLIVPPENFQYDLGMLSRMIRQHGVSHLLCIPSFYEVLLDELNPEDLGGLECVIVAGEACPVGLVNKHHERLPQVGLYNEYGPSEGAVWSTVFLTRKDDGADLLPIGRPIARVNTYVLDSSARLAPVGVAGELYLGGAGIARGYLNRPDITAEKFVPDPFSGKAGMRLYRSGDMARYLADGDLQFLGRADDQVKIRGVRVEPEEVAAQIAQHPSVRQSIVVTREDGQAGKQLVGYVVLKKDCALSAAQFKEFLRGKLPEEMVPPHLVRLDALPLGPNGKVDRGALPAPERETPDEASDSNAPGTPTEETVRKIWAEVLSLDSIGMHDNFFDLGGHSLLATRVVSKVQLSFQVELPIYSLFDSPTIAEFARDVDNAARRA